MEYDCIQNVDQKVVRTKLFINETKIAKKLFHLNFDFEQFFLLLLIFLIDSLQKIQVKAFISANDGLSNLKFFPYQSLIFG